MGKAGVRKWAGSRRYDGPRTERRCSITASGLWSMILLVCSVVRSLKRRSC
jgi:hypothetical protein